MESLRGNEVCNLVKLPEDRKTFGSKWVFKVKVGPDSSIERYKARLVAQGYLQKYGLDYDETFSPVVRTESVRTVIALAAKNNLLLHQMDVTTAFLNGILEEEMYMKQPENQGECIGFLDADWAGDLDDRRSTSGYLFQMCGTAVSWRSKKQTCVTLSTAEAEYMALASAGQESIWIRQLVRELNNEPTGQWW